MILTSLLCVTALNMQKSSDSQQLPWSQPVVPLPELDDADISSASS